MEITKGTVIAASSITAGLVLLLGIGTFTGYKKAQTYEIQLKNTYMRSLQELTNTVNTISTELNRSNHAGSSKQISSIASTIASQADNAKSQLSVLPLNTHELSTTYRFLSQVGEYATAIAKKVENGEQPTTQEVDNMVSLGNYAHVVNEQINTTLKNVIQGDLTSPKNIKNLSFQSVESSLSDYPNLSYNGSASQDVLTKKPVFIQDKESLSKEDCLKEAAKGAQTTPDKLSYQQDENSSIPAYCYTGNGVDVSVSKNGGVVTHMLKSRNIGDSTLTQQQGIEKAQAYLSTLGITNAKPTYSRVQGNLLDVSFAAHQDNIRLHNDTIKMTVALDNGEIISYDSKGYVNTHQNREIEQMTLNKEDAQAVLSKNVQVQSSGMSLIPTKGNDEILAHEFVGKNENGNTVLVYVNALTGDEEHIIMLQDGTYIQ